MAGLFFGIVTLTWVASGLLSMNPWGLLDSEAMMTMRKIDIGALERAVAQALAMAWNRLDARESRVARQNLAIAYPDAERWPGGRAGERADLTKREFDLLAVLAENAGVVLSRQRLLELVWGYDFDVDTNVADVFISYLRRKLEREDRPRVIHTVRGIGYVLREEA